jgi:DNA invertase Pin-like site-specific DNA recombinase
LLIARLDRLARNVKFISSLMEEGVPFVACDMPNATPFMLHVYAAVAEEEARAISKRTRAALAAAKARGVKLGGDRGYRGGKGPPPGSGAAGARLHADRAASSVLPHIEEIRATKADVSLNGLAKELSARNVLAPRGGTWTATAVRRLLARVQ